MHIDLACFLVKEGSRLGSCFGALCDTAWVLDTADARYGLAVARAMERSAREPLQPAFQFQVGRRGRKTKNALG